MKIRILTILFILLAGIRFSAIAGTLYFTGGFNNWDISHPLVVEEKDGLYVATIDFSSDNSFKLSSKNPEGSWNAFDEATLYPTGSLRGDEWCAIEYRQTSPNIIAPAKRIYTVKVDLDNMCIMFSTGADEADPWSGTLPVLFINTADNAPVVSKDTYLKATCYLDPMGTEGIDAVGSAESPVALQIKGRGNYTWIGFEKKPYRLKLDKKTALMGMDKSKHFALLAHADDSAAGLRNALGFAASDALGLPWTPATAPLEVVLNGDYIGLYWLTETIRVDSDRVDVVEQEDNATTDVDGGWLVEIDNYDTDPHVTVTGSDGRPIWFTYKSPEILSTEQETYLQDAMQAIQNAVAKEDEAQAASLVDFETLARYFITNQIMLDMESFHGSCYLYRQRGAGQKWQFGPVWDFGNAFAAGRADNPRFIFDRPDFTQVWIGEFYKMAGFVEEVKDVWLNFLPDGPVTLQEALATNADRIAVAAINDARRWPQYAHADISYQASLLQRYLNGSIAWLKQQWGEEAGVDEVTIPGNSSDDWNADGWSTNGLHIRITGTTVSIRSDIDRTLPLTSLDGTVRLLRLAPGTTTLTLAPGFYILANRKILLR